MHAPLTPARCATTVLVAAAAAAIVLLASLAIGSVTVDFGTVARALTGADTTSEGAAIVRALRAPRALSAFAVGGLLALAGALLQVLLRNPLADPYVLGVSGGAAVGALGALLLGAGAMLGPAAFGGALVSTLLVFALARDAERPLQPTRLLLTGIVLASGWGAVVALLLTLAPMAQVKGMLYWLLGDLSGAAQPLPALAALAGAIVARSRCRAHSTCSCTAPMPRRRSASTCGASRSPRTRSRHSAQRRPSQWRAASASSGSSCRTRCGSSSATTSARCCRPRR